MLRQTIFKSNLLFLWLLLLTTNSMADTWQKLAPGIQYQDLSASLFNPWSHIHVFEIDLKNNKLGILLARQFSKSYASIDEFAKQSHALIAINGGFFDRKYRPLGLRINNHHQENPLKRISWWGVFYTKDKKAYVSSYKQFRSTRAIDFALQSGPRLLINGHIPSLKPGTAERSALGITKTGTVIMLITDNTPMTTKTLAELMKSPPLNCTDALNLDGGNSSQLKANLTPFELSVHGFSHVSDAVIVKSRSAPDKAT